MHNYNHKAVLRILLTTAGLAGCGYAQASIVDTPVFNISGVVIVWSGDGAGGAVVGDFLIGSGGQKADVLDGTVQPVITGTLTSALTAGASSYSVSGQTLNDQGDIGVLDAGDSFSAFSPTESITASAGHFQSSFYVASNTAFTIRAKSSLDTSSSSSEASLDDVYRTLTVEKSGTDGGLSYGASSRFPHSGNTSTSGVRNNGSLSKLENKAIVFKGDRSTAISSGTIADQSVRFTNTYELESGGFEQDAQTIVANVVYTVAIP